MARRSTTERAETRNFPHIKHWLIAALALLALMIVLPIAASLLV